MIYGLYQSAAGMLVNEYRQDVLANNLANADTVGFKRDIATFAERVPATEAGLRRGASADLLRDLSGGLWLARTVTDYRSGSLQRTDNPLDVALDGDGFLLVEQNGEALATRDGRLLMDADGALVAAADGAAVLGVGGAPIRLNPRGGTPAIDSEGGITQDGMLVGRLALVDFADYGRLRKVGQGRLDMQDSPPAVATARVLSGVTESSGVEPVRELVSMIEAARAYQLNAQMVSLQDESAGRLINQVSRS